MPSTGDGSWESITKAVRSALIKRERTYCTFVAGSAPSLLAPRSADKE